MWKRNGHFLKYVVLRTAREVCGLGKVRLWRSGWDYGGEWWSEEVRELIKVKSEA